MITMNALSNHSVEERRIFDKTHLRDYALIILGIGIITVIYHLIFGQLTPSVIPGPTSPPGDPSGLPPQQPPNQGGGLKSFMNSWPIWGTLTMPNIWQILLGISIISFSLLFIWKIYPRVPTRLKVFAIIIFSISTILLTNLIQGWEAGIVNSIGSPDGIYQDAVGITSIVEFISNYETLQPTLTTHALTQPPGAVVAIYILYLLFGNPAGIAIGLASICTVVSIFTLKRIFSKFLSEDISTLGAFLFGILPAIQVYYLANIYAIVSTLAVLALYFYMHENVMISYAGLISTIFLGSFTSFLFLTIPLAFLLYEVLGCIVEFQKAEHDSMLAIIESILKPLSVGVSIIAIYALLELTIGFNYVSAFLYASASENPEGFMLISNPLQYFVTRIQDVLDILIFLGPVLIALCYRGIKELRAAELSSENQKMLLFVIASFLALALLFLTGAPKKGETARICMFILPFVLLPVLYRIDTGGYSKRQQLILLSVVFIQAVLIQLFGTYVW